MVGQHSYVPLGRHLVNMIVVADVLLRARWTCMFCRRRSAQVHLWCGRPVAIVLALDSLSRRHVPSARVKVTQYSGDESPSRSRPVCRQIILFVAAAVATLYRVPQVNSSDYYFCTPCTPRSFVRADWLHYVTGYLEVTRPNAVTAFSR